MTAASAGEGDFLIHARENSDGNFIMVLMFRGKISRHLLKRNEAGFWTVNQKLYTPEKTLAGVSAVAQWRGVWKCWLGCIGVNSAFG